ncbi:TetR/AcrR family transcriptional regulator [Anaerovorax odorimutans]|uniref:TetR/AcrR family transcriptional regulator n=1 Tax=Anaerovorax odorimutans TaxID=109327 RepID=A0ABT1RP15_9FIRM|nr:helix-turn-helix domain-containing protein [Anaerovorax odorimutans]MCQ4636656.1 TetR/AcrR family transcriptional regulator [Anaerovorax odorimutans]
MPKQKITKEEILSAAFQLLRKKGLEAVNARSVAKEAGCSVQPIYSSYTNMDELLKELFEYCRSYQLDYVRNQLDEENYFGSAGRGHILFAREEKNLFRFLFLSRFVRGRSLEDIYKQYGIPEVTGSIEKMLGLTFDEARQLYLDLMIYTHGIAAMLATDALDTADEDIHRNVDHAYHAFLEEARRKK